ncbi:MAG: hypothetical protein ACT4PS_14685 [Betaproteobacteria bacterium]
MKRMLLLLCGVVMTGCAASGRIAAVEDDPPRVAAYREQLYRLCRDMGLPPGTLLHLDCMLAAHERNRSNMGADAPSVVGTILH